MTRQRPRRPYGTGTIEELPTGLFRARIWVSGFRREKSFPKRSAAKNWLDGQAGEKAARADGTFAGKGSRPDLTLQDLRDDFLADLKAAGRTRQTVKGYRSHVDRVLAFCGGLCVAEVDGPQLEHIVKVMHGKKWAPATIRQRLAALSGMVKYAQRQGYTPARPLPVRRPKITLASRPAAYTAEEVVALTTAARQDPDPRVLCAILLASDAGLRREEIVRFLREDLNEKSVTITVPVRGATDQPKSGKARMLPITTALKDAILACPAGPGQRVVGLSTWNTGDQLPHWLEPVWLAAGVQGGTRIHRLRHYWASALANGGHATPWELLEWGGWASLDMVRRYYHAPLTVNRGPLDGLDRSQIVHEWSMEEAKATGAGKKAAT